jgi:hypothetical protein
MSSRAPVNQLPCSRALLETPRERRPPEADEASEAGKEGLERYARQVSDPRDTAHYGKYLTAAQTRERFGVDDAQLKGVRD